LFGPGGTPKRNVPPGAGGSRLPAAAHPFTLPAPRARVKLRSLPEWLDDPRKRGLEEPPR
jgi:hypothetical protein